MTKWWEEAESAPSAAAPATNGGGGKWWEGLENDDAGSSPQEATPKFTPRVGGVVKKEDEKYSKPKYWIAQGLGGTVTRGIPFVRDMIPITESQQEGMAQHPNIETLGNVTGGALGMLPTAGAGGGLGLMGQMGTQGAINMGTGYADRAFHDPNISPQEQKRGLTLDALGGVLGPLAGKAVSPNMVPRNATPGSAAEDAWLNTVEKQSKSASKWLGSIIPDKLRGWLPFGEPIDDALTAAGKAYPANQVMTPDKQRVLNSLLQGSTQNSMPMLTDEQRMRLDALGGQ